ncbi:MAG: acyl--CoA ligase [Actinobacteria bacterium]|nr:acyl--CoA ligase [Actinomycetota bacterium]
MLAETAREAARRFGDRAAIVADQGWSVTYDELDRLSDEVAAGLLRRGVIEGEVVAVCLPASPEHFVAYLAVAKLGAITAAVNPRLTDAERSAVIEASAARLLVSTRELATAPSSVEVEEVEVADSQAGEILTSLRESETSVAPLAPDLDRPIAIVFTSGTTGTPKGAVFCGTQISFITQCDVGEAWGGGGKVMTGSALAHLGPMTKLAGNLKRGSTQYLTSAWNARSALRRISKLGIAAIGGVPTQLALMLRDDEFDSFDLSCVNAIVIGGGPATPALIKEARARFNARLAVRYSCTEAGIGTGTALDDPEEDAEVSVGRPQHGVDLSVVAESGNPALTGEIGEVCLRSPAVMRGYWGDDAASGAAFTPDGSVRTGDLGWIDERGRLHLAGRSKERYVRGGYNVYPMEVEAVLAEHPGIASVAVVGRQDDVMGEVGVAVVVAKDGTAVPTLEELRKFASSQLAKYKLPDEVMKVDALPNTAMDKVDRRALQAMVAKRDSS